MQQGGGYFFLCPRYILRDCSNHIILVVLDAATNIRYQQHEYQLGEHEARLEQAKRTGGRFKVSKVLRVKQARTRVCGEEGKRPRDHEASEEPEGTKRKSCCGRNLSASAVDHGRGQGGRGNRDRLRPGGPEEAAREGLVPRALISVPRY